MSLKTLPPMRQRPVSTLEEIIKSWNFELLPLLRVLAQQSIPHGTGDPTHTPETATALYLQDDGDPGNALWVFSAGVWNQLIIVP